MNTFFTKDELINYVFIISGSLILSLALVGFFLPNNIITGGTAGLALLLHYITPLTIGSLIALINLPLLILGNKYLGRMFTIRTIITIVMISLFIDLFSQIIKIEAFIQDTILAAIFGGIFVGLGLALVIKGNSSAGGSTILAKIISSKTEIKPGQVILIIDIIIILSALFIFEDREKILWSIVSIYITAKMIDYILTGSLNKKVVYLVTQKTDELKQLITQELGPEGAYNGVFEQCFQKYLNTFSKNKF